MPAEKLREFEEAYMTILAGRNCIITGASKGLGAKIAAAFWRVGANLILVARSKEMLHDVVTSLLQRPHQRVTTIEADLGDPLSVDKVVCGAKEVFESLDVLVNNAGICGPIGPVWTNDWDEWKWALQVNMLSIVALCRQCVPWMANAGRGKIINLSGGGATHARANFSAYATSKAGLVRFSETLAEEARDLGIDVNCIAPGAMDTTLITEVLESGPSVAGQKEYEDALKVRQTGGASLERVADLCVFLASSRSDEITGKLISAIWDPWERLPENLVELQKTDIYTLRRIVPKDRGKDWGDR